MSHRVNRERWQAVSPHLDRALEIPGEQRAAWLAALRADDKALAADLEALLEEHDALKQEGFLEGLASPLPAPGSLAQAAAGDPPLDPEGAEYAGGLPGRIGPYRMVRELGRGGMGRVYLAEQEGEDFRRLVALKVIEPGGPGAELQRRFRDERRILAGLEHPGIARFYDAGRAPDGHWFLALEYVEGPNLLEHARRGGLPTDERVRLFLAVLDAVDFAHARSIVHRDLKPGNILVGADGRPRLLDFGIAKLLDPDPDAPATETRTELRALTPAYASPEQFRGERVTSASDVFSLGVVLYELLAGVRPFAANATSRAALERAVLTEDPDPPSTASCRATTRKVRRALHTRVIPFRRRRGTVARDLDAVCLKALRKEPGERYASAASFAQDLRCYLGGRPVAARAGSRRYRLARFARRHRGRLATAAALTLAGVAMVVAAGAQRRAAQLRLPDPPAPRTFPFSDVGSTPIAELERQFAAAPASVEAGAALALGLADDGRGQEAALILARLRQIPGKEQDPLTDYADASVAMDLDEPQRALVLFTRARDGALAGGRGELLAQVRAARGRLLSTLGQRDEGRREMELARDDLRRAGDHASLARVVNDLAIEEVEQGELARGEALLEEAVAAGRAAGRPSESALSNLGQLAAYRGRPDLAEPKLREAVDLWRRSGSPRRVGHALGVLSEAVRDLGHVREAEPLLDESIVLLRRAGEDAALVSFLFYRAGADIGSARLDRIDETVREMEGAARVAGSRPSLGFARHVRGRAAAVRNDLEAARRHFGAARRLLVDNGDLANASEMEVVWAEAEHAAGHPDAALRLLDEALGRLRGGGAGSPPAFFAETLRARIAAEAGRPLEARRRLEALGEETARSPSVSRRLAFLGSRAALARAERRFDEARRDLDSALRLAQDAERTLDSLALRLDRAELELAAGARPSARATAEQVRREAASRGLAALAQRARRLARASARAAPSVGHPA